MERDEILARLRERIVAFAASHLAREAAEDLAQEVLMLLHEKYAHLERMFTLSGHVLPWPKWLLAQGVFAAAAAFGA